LPNAGIDIAPCRIDNDSIDQVACFRNIVHQPYGLADSHVGRLEIVSLQGASIFLISSARTPASSFS
jgi:hypothetical protein